MDATLKISILSEEQLKHIQKAERELLRAGVSFDTGYGLVNNIRDWELDWSLEGTKLTDKKELVFDSQKIKTSKYIMNAEGELKQADVYFNSRLDDKERIIWELNELHGAVLVVRKPRKVSTEVKPKLKPPFNIYRKTKHK